MENTIKMKMRVDIQNLMLQSAKEMNSFGITMGFQISQGCLIRIAKRAIELNDEALLEELDTLCLIKNTEGK